MDSDVNMASPPPSPPPESLSSLFDFKECPTKGKYWIATTNLEPGTILLDELPVLWAPSWEDEDETGAKILSVKIPRCVTCGLQTEMGKKIEERTCSNCQWPVCSKTCEKSPAHAENECKIFAAHKVEFPPSDSVKPKQLSYAIQTIRGLGLKNRNDPLFNDLMELAHCQQDQTPKFVTGNNDCWDQLKVLVPGMEFEEDICKRLIRLCGINGYESDFSDHKNSSVYVWSNVLVYLKASWINHSCVPNCSWTTGPPPDLKIRIRTAVAVEKGEPLTIAYSTSQVRLGTMERQIYFRNEMGFTCKCKRCLDPTELGTFTSAITCKNCRPTIISLSSPADEGSGYFLPLDPLNVDEELAEWKCTKCDKIEFASQLIPEIKAINDKLMNFARSPDPVTGVDDGYEVFCESILRDNRQSNLLHKNHWLVQSASRDIAMSQATKFLANKPILHEMFLKLSRHVLTIQDVLFPGLSNERGNSLICIFMAVIGLALKNAKKMRKDMALQYLELSGKYKADVLNIFEEMEPKAEGKLKCVSAEAWSIYMTDCENDVQIAMQPKAERKK